MSARPNKSPARTRPDVAPSPPVLTAEPSHGDLKLIAQTLCLPPLAKSNSADLVAQIKASSKAKQEGDAGVCTALVHAAFKLIDKNGDGVLSRIEVVKALRDSAQVRKLLALPEKIRQEDGTRDLFERVYQSIDTDDSKSITLAEFEAYFSPATRPAASTWSDGTVFASITVAFLGVAYALLLIRHLALAKLSVGGTPSAAAAAAAVNSDATLAASAVGEVAKTVAARVAAAVANSAVGVAFAGRVAEANSAAGAAAAPTVATAAAADDATAPADDATADDGPAAESSGAAVYRAAGHPPVDAAGTPAPRSM